LRGGSAKLEGEATDESDIPKAIPPKKPARP